MSDEMDIYLGRSLKNWSRRFRPAADGKKKLLRLASTSQEGRLETRPEAGLGWFLQTLQTRYTSPLAEYDLLPLNNRSDSLVTSQNLYWYLSVNMRIDRLTS